MNTRDKFLTLLKKDILKLDMAELDFGIYRILHYRQREIEEFLDKQLPDMMTEALKGGAEERLKGDRKRLDLLRGELEKVAQSLGLSAAFGVDELAPALRETPKGKEFMELQQKVAKAQAEAGFVQSEEERLYNALYTFFSRYYKDADFLPLCRRSREARYSVPYSGEDVHFHWATRGSHYIKSGEEFTTYAYTDGSWRVQFDLVKADVEADNVKGKERYFIPEGLELGDGTRLTVKITFRPLTEKEEKLWSSKKGKKSAASEEDGEEEADAKGSSVQNRILEARLPELHPLPTALSRNTLSYHLTRYAKKNRTDYFVHPHLGEFLYGEFEYFLKNEFLELEAFTNPEAMADRWLKMKVLREIGEKIIAFLDQIETFQARLFEKRKFVLETYYLVPVRLIPEALWPEIIANDKQLKLWRDWFALERAMTIEVLREYPTAVVNTRLYDESFVQKLLGAIEDVDDAIDGLILYSENYAGLRSLTPMLRGRTQVIYIDPPYNTGVDEFLYKDEWSQHSAWLSMMEGRLRHGRDLLEDLGRVFINIDFVESARLKLLCDLVFGSENFLADVAWEKRYTRSNNAKLFYSLKDTVMAYRKSANLSQIREPRSEGSKEHYSNPDNDPRGPWISSSYVNPATKEERPNLVYPIRNPFTGKSVEHPTHAWKYDKETHAQHVAKKRLYWGPDGSYEYPRLKSFLSEAKEGMVPVDLWRHEESGTTDDGGDAIKALFGSAVFDNPKPPSLIERAIETKPPSESNPLIFDFFAGSGTTGHATINLNRNDGSRRRFVLVEMGGYVDTVLIPRIGKVMYTPNWRGGEPKEQPKFNPGEWPEWVERSPRLVKVLCLERYEDSLNALELPAELKPHLESQKDLWGEEGFLLRYLLPVGTEDSEVWLNTEKLTRPFDYKLRVHSPDGVQEKRVDLPETFSLLMGHRLKRVREARDGVRRYLLLEATEHDRPVLTIWRTVDDTLQPDHEKSFLAKEVKTLFGKSLTDYTTVYHNADAALPNGMSLDAEFKRRMLERDPHFTRH